MDKQERHKILVEWNETQADFPFDRCLHQLFEDNVTRSPDSISLLYKDISLSASYINLINIIIFYFYKGI